MAVESPRKTALYCYGVMEANVAKRRRKGGLGGKPVEPVVFEGLAALTSEVPPGKVRARRADLLCHFDVLGTAFESGPVLPMRFGIVFDDESSLVEELLEPRHDELAGMLGSLRDRVELRVSAHYRGDVVLAEVVRENARIARLREATRGRGAGAHPALIELGELVAAELQARTARDSRGLLERLRPLALDQQLDEEPIENQVLRGSFLVDRGRVGAFEAALEDFASAQAGRIDVKVVGPLPPHSFVELRHEGRR